MEKEQLLYIDDLTGVKNRRYLKDLTLSVIPSVTKDGTVYTVAIVDLDHFKEVNDTYGHLKGDSVIKAFANFLKDNLRKDDVVIRYGGDEFVIFQPGLTHKNSKIVWQRIISNLKNTPLSGIQMSMSVGLASYPEDGKDFDTLFKEADERLYIAKRSGRGRIGENSKIKLNFESHVFVDRSKEKEILKSAIIDKHVAIVKGQVRIGKTRLIRETLSRLKGWEILWATCLPFNYNIPYYPIRELTRYKIERYGKKALKGLQLPYKVEIAKIVPSLIESIDEHSIESVGKELDRYRLFEGLKKIIGYGDLPKVVIIDDIQWMDVSSIEFLEYLIMDKKLDISYVFATRIEEENPDSIEFLRIISRNNKLIEISVKPLSLLDTRKMLEHILGHPLPRLEKYISEKSAGIPFFIEEILKELQQNGFLYVNGEKWDFKYPASEVIPRTIEDVIVRKFNTLSEEAKNMITLGSVAGEIDLNILQKLLGFNEGHIIGLVETAIKKGILKEESGTIKFADEITRDTIYRNFIGKIKKKYYHKRIAGLLEERHKQSEDEIVEKLAYHYREAMVPDKCVKYSILSGDKAKSVYANEEAINFYTQALFCMQSGTSELEDKYKSEILKKRAKVLSLVGRYEEAIKDIEELLKTAREKDNKLEMALAYEYLSDIYTSLGDYENELLAAQKSLSLYKETGFKKGIGQSLNLIGIAYFNIASYEKALSMFKESLKVLSETDSEELTASVYNNIGVIYNEVLLDFEKAKEYFRKSLNIREKINDIEGIGSTLNNLGFLYDNMRDFEKSMEYYNKSLELSRKIGDIEGEAIALLNIGVAYEEQDKFYKALENYEKALEIARTTGHRAIENIALNNLGITYKEIGNYKKSIDYTLKSLELSRELKDRKGVISCLKALSDIYFELDEIENSEKYLKQALSELKTVNDPENRISCKISLSEIESRKGNFEEALSFIKEVKKEMKEYTLPELSIELLITESENYLNWSRIGKAKQILEQIKNAKITRPAHIAKIWQIEGRILAKEGKIEESKKIFKKSLDAYRKIGLKIGTGITLYHAANLLMDKDTDFALKCAREAIDIFKEIGASKWESKTITLLN